MLAAELSTTFSQDVRGRASKSSQGPPGYEYHLYGLMRMSTCV